MDGVKLKTTNVKAFAYNAQKPVKGSVSPGAPLFCA
jgi:hypothetical protein